MRTRLQSHVHGRPRRLPTPRPAIRQSRPLSVQPPQLGMKPFADYIPTTRNDSSHQRIRANPPAPALSKLQSSPQMTSIRVSEQGFHG
jgi:hypothetical protein